MGNNNNTFTPKATVTFVKLGPGFDLVKSSSGVGNFTLKTKINNFTLSVATAPSTAKGLESFKNVTGTLELKLNKSLKINVSRDLNNWQKLGATFEDRVLKKTVTLKAAYGLQNKVASGDATITISKQMKTNVTFTQKQLLTAKHTFTFGPHNFEPAYNFISKAPSLSVSRKEKKDTFKIAYDFKSNQGSLEWSRKPMKAVLQAPIALASKPTLALTYEADYEF